MIFVGGEESGKKKYAPEKIGTKKVRTKNDLERKSTHKKILGTKKYAPSDLFCVHFPTFLMFWQHILNKKPNILPPNVLFEDVFTQNKCAHIYAPIDYRVWGV